MKVTVNKSLSYEAEKNSGGLLLNGETFEMDLEAIDSTRYHAIIGSHSYTAEVVSYEAETKTFRMRVHNRMYEVSVQDRIDLLLEKMGMSGIQANKVKSLKAPMPGHVMEVDVKAGQEVAVGDPVLILEAMKMENVLKSPGDGIVKEIKVVAGENVEKGHVLIVFE